MLLMTRTDVTAVKFFDNYVLTGIGSQVNVFDKNSGSFLCKKEVLTGQKIYGFVISKCGRRVLVFGGKKFTVVKVKPECVDDNLLERCFAPVVCDDWLHSCLWANDNVALLTAHNVVQKWDVRSQTLLSKHASKDNSILYSGLLVPLHDDVLVMAGTVFSEVIIHKCGDEAPLHRLTGHKGVIFSISCEPDKNLIVTTSDDRSVRIWAPKTVPLLPNNSIEYWKSIDIVCLYELYGHQARVMRNCITNNNVISVGEDSAICIWDFQGNLVKKHIAHQNSCIWAVDYSDNLLVTGGGDCGVVLHPITTNNDFERQVINIEVGIPKKIVLTARMNIVILNDRDDLIHYNIENKKTTVYKLIHGSTYKLLSLSPCKQVIAVADMDGKFDVFVENCKNEPLLFNLIDTKLHIDKILSMHWADNRHLVLCSENGSINVLAYNSNTEHYANFILPTCKERFLTAAAVDAKGNIFLLGDRCGNVHVFVKGKQDPIKTFNKVHGRYGPTSINIRDNEAVTTGRDGTIRYFYIDVITNQFNYMNRKDLEFQWVEKFLDKDDNMICGFQERVFVVYNIRDSCKVLEVECGGGHRSWDAQRCIIKANNEFEPMIQLIYIKNSEIHLQTCFLDKVMTRNLINGSHSKEINCLRVYKNSLDVTKTFYISGGEDTTLRVSSADDRDNMLDVTFRDEVVFKHLSSVRTLKLVPTTPDELFVLSAGGRAQINIKHIKFTKIGHKLKLNSRELVDYLVKGTDKLRKGNQSWKNCVVDFDPETRIMDIDVIKDNEELFIFVGCSDAVLRIFSFNNTFQLITESKYHKTCILKTHCFRFMNKDILATATTRGDVAFWLVNKHHLDDNLEPFYVLKTRESGINSLATKVLENTIVVVTGGDDNGILLQMLKINQDDLTPLAVESEWSSSNYHSSQITGVFIVEDLLLTTSIDQRITVFEWHINNGIKCEYKSQFYTNVADVQGMDVFDVTSESMKVCVFGKGLEVVSIPKH